MELNNPSDRDQIFMTSFDLIIDEDCVVMSILGVNEFKEALEELFGRFYLFTKTVEYVVRFYLSKHCEHSQRLSV